MDGGKKCEGNAGSAQLVLLDSQTHKRRESAHFTWRKGTTLEEFTNMIYRHSQALLGSYKSYLGTNSSPSEDFREQITFLSTQDNRTPVEIQDIFWGKIKAVNVVYNARDRPESFSHGSNLEQSLLTKEKITPSSFSSTLSTRVGRDQHRFMELMSWNKDKTIKTEADTTVISWLEVAKHNKVTDCWVVLNDHVYDITNYLQFHPGGSQILAALGGKDVTFSFYKYHPWVNAAVILQHNYLGRIEKQDPKQALAE